MRAGVPFEVVPGVTAAVATSAYAGISLTHRDFASGVAFVTGHENPQKGESSLDYSALAKFPGTLVFYMGLHRLPVIADWLDAGRIAWLVTDDAVRNGYPLGQEAVSSVIVAATGSMRFVAGASFFYVAAGALSVWP